MPAVMFQTAGSDVERVKVIVTLWVSPCASTTSIEVVAVSGPEPFCDTRKSLQSTRPELPVASPMIIDISAGPLSVATRRK